MNNTIIENKLTTQRTTRYYTLGNSTNPKEVWFVFHGYGQLASRFIEKFDLFSSQNLIVAPEGLSRFYLSEKYEKVGASWMTKADREDEIADQVQLLNNVLTDVNSKLPLNELHTSLFGFSQGCATMNRWMRKSRMARKMLKLDSIVYYAGEYMLDVGFMDSLKLQKVIYALGDQDIYISEKQADIQPNISRYACESHFIPFEGGHRIRPEVMQNIQAILAG